MIGLLIAIVIFNIMAFATNKRLTKNQIIHIWLFTMVYQMLVDLMIDKKFQGYWYFSEATDWKDLLPITILIPPVNMMFLNWYPFGQRSFKHVLYIAGWVLAIVGYEALTLLPEPWGYFHYGWWRLWYSVIVNPFLLLSVIIYYKWVCKIEKSLS